MSINNANTRRRLINDLHVSFTASRRFRCLVIAVAIGTIIVNFIAIAVVIVIVIVNAVAFVIAARDGVAATITAHHLLFNRNDMLAGGIRSANAHYANMLLAFYLATGQDAANIVEGSQGIVHAEVRGKDLYFSTTLPNLIVGSIGAGKYG